MKKIYTALFILFFLSVSMFAQQSVNIDSAIDAAVSEIKAAVPSGVEIAVATIGADTKELSDYIAKELESRLIRTGKFKLLERNAQNLRIINAEMDYQYSGSVDDSSMVELGYRLGAKYLVYGSFEQFGGLMQLTIKATSVETGEIPVIASFSIASSAKITDLLGDQRALNTAQDYLDMIARCQQKLNSIENDKNKEIQNNTSNIYAKYQTQINEARAREKEPWESTAEHEEIIAKNVLDLESKRDTELSGVSRNVSIKYDNQYKMVELQMEKLTEDLQNTSFVLKGDSVQVFIGDFDSEAKPKNWPVSIRSLDKLVNYTYNGKRTVSDADVRTEFYAMEEARKNGTLEGEITYKVESTDSKMRFNIRVISVRVNNTSSYTTIVNETVNKVVGSVNATSQLTGSVSTTEGNLISVNSESNQIASANIDSDNGKGSSGSSGFNVNTSLNSAAILDYTTGQKIGLGFQNILFGLGSYRTGHWGDGVILTIAHGAAIGLISYALLLDPNDFMKEEVYMQGIYRRYVSDEYFSNYDTFLFTGLAIEGVALLYGFIRPLFYEKQPQKIGALGQPDGLKVSLAPSTNGLVSQVSYRMSF